MDKIEFQNNQYKLREIELPEIGNVLISTTSLNNFLLNNDDNYVSDEAISVDENIYFFVDENEIELSDDELFNLLTTVVK